MFKLFRSHTKKTELPEKKTGQSLIRWETDDNENVLIFFQRPQNDAFEGEWVHSWVYGHTIDIPKNVEDQETKHLIQEHSKDSGDFIQKGESMFLIRQINNEDILHQGEILVSFPILCPKDGVIECCVDQNHLLNEGDLVCKISSSNNLNSNHPENPFYIGKFDRFSIPKEIRDKDQIAGKFIYISDWLVSNGDSVKLGDDLCEISGGNDKNIYFTFKLKSNSEGIIDILSEKINPIFYSVDGLKQRQPTYITYKNNEIRYNQKYFNEPLIQHDEFDGNTILQWNIVGGYTSPYGVKGQNPIGGIICKSSNSKDLIFSFENHQNKDYIVFYFFNKEYKLRNGDLISFLFENQTRLDFEISEYSNKAGYSWEKLFSTKCILSLDELKTFSSEKISKWRITFKSGGENLTGDGNGYWYFGEIFHKVVQSLANDYQKLVSAHIQNYSPIQNKETSNIQMKSLDEGSCFVYLMKDESNGFHKIGISNDPRYRERTLQSEKPTIELLCKKEYPSRKIAESFEKALHSTFSDKRLRGEWFELSPEEVIEIMKTLK